jgi:hypothetical protein
MQYIIIPIVTLIAGLYTGFYFGYVKREKQPPPMPIINEIRQLKEYMDKVSSYVETRLEDAEIKQRDDKEPKSWFDQ